MKRIIFTVFIVIPVLITAFAVGAFVAIRSNWGEPIVSVLVKNETDRDVESITVTYTTCGVTRKLSYDRREQLQATGDSQKVLMHFVLCGEGSHRTAITLNNGETLVSQGSYVQGGYKVTERITNSGLVSEHKAILP